MTPPSTPKTFFDVRRDIDAAVQTVRALGYKALVLQSHSLGNIQVQFYAATNWDRDIKAVMLLGPFGNLPWKTRSILVQNEDSFRGLIDAAMKSLRDGQHFLTYRWTETSVADGTFWIHRIPIPILLVRDRDRSISRSPRSIIGVACARA
jgi:pimeloyl-ACP methyl ester carboxylesterase